MCDALQKICLSKSNERAVSLSDADLFNLASDCVLT